MVYIKKIPFFLLLLVLFFCLHGSVENYGFINAAEVLQLGLLIAAGGAVLFALIYLFSRDHAFTALLTCFIGLWYLFFGALQDWLKTIPILFFLQRYTYLLPALVLATVLWIVFLKKKKQVRTKLFIYLNIVLLLYCILDAGQLLTKYFAASPQKNNSIAFDYSKVQSKPNVYYLLFDEYPGYKSLKDSFGFANDSLYHFMAQKGFRELPVFANYNFTLLSMSSIFNMRYVDAGYDSMKLTAHDNQLRTAEIRNGAVFDIFKNMGYTIKNYSVFDIGDQDGVSNKNSFLPMHVQLLSDKILHNRIMRTSGFLLLNSEFLFQSWGKKMLFQHDTDNAVSIGNVKKASAVKEHKPQFCYAHFMLPHFPLYRDSMGRYNSLTTIRNENAIRDKGLFLSYVKYTNMVIRYLVDSITLNDPGAVVAVMSDHGYRSYNRVGYDPYQLDNICFLRLPVKNELIVRERWSAINFFPFLFNSAFGQNIPYLDDHTVNFP